jgi:hypothetical protein
VKNHLELLGAADGDILVALVAQLFPAVKYRPLKDDLLTAHTSQGIGTGLCQLTMVE